MRNVTRLRNGLLGILCAQGMAFAQVAVEETVTLPTTAAWGGGDVVGSKLIGRTYNAGNGPGIWIVADGGYRLYLNGELLAQDNVAGRVTFVPMTFLPGTNALSVAGVDGNGAPGVLVQIDELDRSLVSGSGWKVSTSVTDNTWKSRTFNDASWAAATASGTATTTPSGKTLSGFASGSTAKWIWAGSATSTQAVLRLTFKIQAEGFGAATTGGDGGAIVVASDSTSIIKALQDAETKVILIPEGTYDLRRRRNAVTEAKAASRTWCKRACGSSDANSSNTYYRVAFEANSCASLADGSTPVAESENLMAWSNWITTKANKTLIGMGRGANLRGASINMRANEGAKNQIYRNLGIYDVNPHLVEGGDGLSIVGGSTNRTGKYWADHISYKWISDGLDIEYATETTISWLDYDGRNEFNCYQTDPYVALVEDADVTYANVYWHATMGRVPKVRSGTNPSRVHLYNNYLDTNTYYMIGAEGKSATANSQVLFENNAVNWARYAFVMQGANGFVNWTGNLLTNSTAKYFDNNVASTTVPTETVFTPPYSYAKRSTAVLAAENPLHAGAGGRWGKPLVYNQPFGLSNQAPTVVLTSPVAGSSTAASATLTLTATASDADGSVKSVAFYSGTQLLGTATAAPWSVTASALGAGTHSLVAVATDNSGLVRMSEFVTVTVIASNPVFTSGKSLSIPENTTAVVTVAATSPSGKTVSYAIAGGEDSALFTIATSTGKLAFKTAPDFEKPTDNGLDNIYKVIVEAADGVGSAKQSIAVLVTDVSDAAVGVGEGGVSLFPARVLWMDVRGNILREEVQRLDPSAPRPVVPAGHKGIALARIRFEGTGFQETVRSVAAPE